MPAPQAEAVEAPAPKRRGRRAAAVPAPKTDPSEPQSEAAASEVAFPATEAGPPAEAATFQDELFEPQAQAVPVEPAPAEEPVRRRRGRRSPATPAGPSEPEIVADAPGLVEGTPATESEVMLETVVAPLAAKPEPLPAKPRRGRRTKTAAPEPETPPPGARGPEPELAPAPRTETEAVLARLDREIKREDEARAEDEAQGIESPAQAVPSDDVETSSAAPVEAGASASASAQPEAEPETPVALEPVVTLVGDAHEPIAQIEAAIQQDAPLTEDDPLAVPPAAMSSETDIPLVTDAAPEAAPTETEPAEEPSRSNRRGPRGRREPRTNIFEAQVAPLDPVEALLEFFRANPKPWPSRDLARRLPDTDLERLGGRRGLEDTLERLVAEGRLIHTRRHTYGLPEEMNLVVGRFQGHAGGFGFLIPETPGLRDLYIPPDATLNAWNGDRVVARTAPRRRAPGGGGPVGGRGEDAPRGQVIRILERSRERIVGTLEYSKGYAILRPDDPKVNHRLLLLPEGTEGVAAGARIVAGLYWPEDTGEDEPYGAILDVLGAEDSPEVETRAVIVKHDLREAFPEDVLAEAERIPLEIPVAALKGRTDLRAKKVFTIDGRDAKDFDDAIHIEPLANGHFLVGVHVADVSHYVVEGKPLDREARDRATSVYLPGRVLPMLPERLSNGVCSLVPNEDRLTMSALVELTPDGSVVNYSLVNSVIHSKARLTYDEVQAFSEGKAAMPEQARALEGDLHLLLKLTTRMRERRFREGSLDFRLREVKVDIEPDGSLKLIPIREETARGLIEDLMLLANKVVAAHLSSRNVPALFRVHEEPSEARFQEVTAALGRMGISVRGGQPTPQAYQEVLANVRGTPQESAVNTLLLRSMRQAKYSSENLGHFGLAFSDYLHFTSPIRRYPDLIVHRVLKASLAKKLSETRKAALEASLPGLGTHTSERERAATEAERDLTKYYQAKWAQAHLGEEHGGYVSGVANYGVFVALENGVEGLLHVSQLEDDYYTFIEDAMLLKGRSTGRSFRLGTPVRVRIQHVNPVARQIDFAPKEQEMELKPRARRRDERNAGRSRGGAATQEPPARDARREPSPEGNGSPRPSGSEGNAPRPAAPEGNTAPRPKDAEPARGGRSRSDGGDGARRVVVLAGRPKGEHVRPVRVTARRLYFGEWSKSNLENDDEGGRGERPSSPNRGNPAPSRPPQRNERPAAPEPVGARPRNADRASSGPREGRPDGARLRFAGGARPAEPVAAEGGGGSRRRRRRRR